MSWLRDFVTPKIKDFIGAKQAPGDLWTKCKSCEKMVYTTDLKASLMVCEHCGFHFPLPAANRLRMLFNEGNCEVLDSAHVRDDPLKFRDTRKYVDRLKDLRQKTGNYEASIAAYGNILRNPAVVFVLDFSFMGGSMGISVGQTFAKAAKHAVEKRAALVTFTASGGARMQEGILALMQMASTVASLCILKEQSLPFINVLTHPTTGGVLASFAMLGDINIAEPDALIGFAGARVIETTIRQKLPEGFQRSEFLRDHGMLDMIVQRKDLKNTIGQLLSYMMN